MPSAFRIALPLLLAGLAGAAHAQTDLPLAELTIGTQRIQVEVAATPAARKTGLMHREALPEQKGMLFVNAGSDIRCMWMKNTQIPLSVAFIDGGRRILNIEDMQPNTRDYHCSMGPAQYALEMESGWFRKNGIKTGDTVKGLEQLRAAE